MSGNKNGAIHNEIVQLHSGLDITDFHMLLYFYLSQNCNTPLHDAASRRHEGIARILLEFKATPDIQNDVSHDFSRLMIFILL